MLRGTLPPVSNRETYTDDVQLWYNGVRLDPTGYTAQIQLESADNRYTRPGYSYNFVNWGPDPTPKLLATTENGGIVIVGGAAFRFTFTLAQMQTLASGQYMLSMVCTTADGLRTRQLFQLQIPVLDGGVPST